jgi:hypothetical protein
MMETVWKGIRRAGAAMMGRDGAQGPGRALAVAEAVDAPPLLWAGGKGKRKRKRKASGARKKPGAGIPPKKKKRKPAQAPLPRRQRKADNWLEVRLNDAFAWWDAQGYGWRDYFRMGLLAGGLLVVLYYAFSAGGYFVVKRGYGELVILYLIILGLLFGLRAGGRVPRLGLLETGFFGGYTLWTLLSVTWSYNPAASFDEFVRAALYLAGYGLFYMYLSRRVWLGWLAHMFIFIAFTVAVDSIFGKIGIIDHPDPFQTNRLSYPLTYWNTMGLLMIMSFPLALRVLADRATGIVVRCLYAPALVLFLSVLFFTFSRAGLLLLMLVFGLYLLVAVSRLRAVMQAAIAFFWTAVVIGFCYLFLPTMVKLIPDPDPGEAKRLGVLMLVVMLLAAGSQVVVWYQEKRITVSEELARRIGYALAGLAAAIFLLGFAAFVAKEGNPVTWVRDQVQVIAEPEAVVEGAEERLLSLQSERYREYQVSVGVFRDNPLKGTGAGTWSIHWTRERPREIQVKDGHSWLFETMAELGLVGTVLMLGFLVTFFIRGVSDLRFLGRSRARELYGAIFVSCVAFALHSVIDWDWEMAVITLSFFLFVVGLLRYGALARAGAAGETVGEAGAGAAVPGEEGEAVAEEPAEKASGGWTPRRMLSWSWLIGVLCVVMLVLTALPVIAEDRVQKATRLAREGKNLGEVGSLADTAHRFNPLDGEPLILKAIAVQAAGDVDEAESLILQAIDLEPYNDKYYRNLTRVYLQKGDPDGATLAIHRSRELNPLESKETGQLEEEVRKLTGGKL